MNSYSKIVPTILGLILCLALVILFAGDPPNPRGWYNLDDELSFHFKSPSFKVTSGILDIPAEVSELGIAKGEKFDYTYNRTEILTGIFEDIEGIVAKGDGEEFVISNSVELEHYVKRMQEQEFIPGDSPSGIVPDAQFYSESYAKDDMELTIDHRVNEIVWRLPQAITNEQAQLEQVRQFATALGIEDYFDFANPIATDEGIIVPTRIQGLPLVAATRDFLLDKQQQLMLLKFQGYQSQPMGLSFSVAEDGSIIKSYDTILPITDPWDNQPVISLEQALDAFRATFDTTFVHEGYASQHEYLIAEIYLAYGAVYTGEGEYSLEPLWVFVDEHELAWDYCFLIHAHSGEIYQKISSEYFREVNPLNN